MAESPESLLSGWVVKDPNSNERDHLVGRPTNKWPAEHLSGNYLSQSLYLSLCLCLATAQISGYNNKKKSCHWAFYVIKVILPLSICNWSDDVFKNLRGNKAQWVEEEEKWIFNILQWYSKALNLLQQLVSKVSLQIFVTS